MTFVKPILADYPKTILFLDGTEAILRSVDRGDRLPLLQFFQRVPEEERHYLKEKVTAPEIIDARASDIDLERALPILALDGERVIADATLYLGSCEARRHVGELRIVVDPSYRGIGLGRRLMRELLDRAADLELRKATLELVAGREDRAIFTAESLGFVEVARLNAWVCDIRGNHEDLVLLEIPILDDRSWW